MRGVNTTAYPRVTTKYEKTKVLPIPGKRSLADDLAGHRASSSPRIAEVYENIKFVSDSSELRCPLPDEMWKYYHESRFASLIRIY
jgi:hypothetical protein